VKDRGGVSPRGRPMLNLPTFTCSIRGDPRGRDPSRFTRMLRTNDANDKRFQIIKLWANLQRNQNERKQAPNWSSAAYVGVWWTFTTTWEFSSPRYRDYFLDPYTTSEFFRRGEDLRQNSSPEIKICIKHSSELCSSVTALFLHMDTSWRCFVRWMLSSSRKHIPSSSQKLRPSIHLDPDSWMVLHKLHHHVVVTPNDGLYDTKVWCRLRRMDHDSNFQDSQHLPSTLHIEVVKPYRFPSTSITSEHQRKHTRTGMWMTQLTHNQPHLSSCRCGGKQWFNHKGLHPL
jgi:hypothetical protein